MRVLAVLAAAVLLSVGAATADPAPTRPHPWPAPGMVGDDHVRQHAAMTEQMRTMSQTGHMVGSMWTDMQTTGHVLAEEHHQAQVDRMLARPTP